MSQMYNKAYGLKIIVTRMFSHEGSRRGKLFALSNFAFQIVQHEKEYESSQKWLNPGDEAPEYVIKVGNLDSVRTYNHISDAVRAYWLIATKGKIGEVYNIGGNYTCTVKDALEKLLNKSFISRDKFMIVVDPKRIRPTDITLQIPDYTKFKNDTGWEPQKGLNEIVDDLLSYWRCKL